MPSNFGPYQPYTGFNTAYQTNTLWTCGQNNYGQLGNGTVVYYSSPIQIGSLTNWTQVSCGYFQASAIKTDGTLWTWGGNLSGQLGNGTTANYSSPIQVGSLTNWSQVAGGTYHTAAIKTDGTLWTWGFNSDGELGNGTNGINYYSPIQVGTLTTWKQVQCGTLHTAAIKTDGTLWTWGYNGSGLLGNGTGVYYSSPIQVGSLTTWNQVATGSSYYILAIQTYNYNQDLGQRYTSKSYLLDVYPNIASQIGNRTSPGLFSWGHDSYGELGIGSISPVSSPIQVGALTNWKQVSSCYSGSTLAAINNLGQLWMCGYNKYGQLGNGSTVYYSSPIQVGALTNWKQVSAGFSHAAAIKTDGTLWTWGNNFAYSVSKTSGQLGNNSQAMYYSSPIQVGALTNWKQVSAGSWYTLAIKTDGTLWGWGWGIFGIFGNNSQGMYYSSPIQVGSLTNWKQVSSGGENIAAIKTDGTLWTCGYNIYGQLGNGTSGIGYSSPIQVGALTNWKQVACGFGHLTAIKTDGTLWTWGLNSTGQLGNGTVNISYSSPIQVGALTNWKQVTGGYYHTAAIKTDGTLWAWGYNNYGTLGNLTSINYSSPIQVGALTNWKQVAGVNHCTITIADGYI